MSQNPSIEQTSSEGNEKNTTGVLTDPFPIVAEGVGNTANLPGAQARTVRNVSPMSEAESRAASSNSSNP